MRESFNFNMIPITEDNMNGIVFNTGSEGILTNVSSNAYYGYQPQIHMQDKSSERIQQHLPKNETYNMEVQFINHKKNDCLHLESGIPLHINSSRKRRWGYTDELDDFKKRRENDKSLHCASEHQAQIPPAQKTVHLRKPTHNIPDLPRCIMENNKDNQTNALKEADEENMLEDILRETHGISIYHWFCNEL